MQSSNDVSGLILALVQKSREGSHKMAYVCRRFGFVLQEMHRFKACVVVDENKQILVPRVMRTHERAGDVGVDKTTRV
eukprot:4175667-Pleurochrysis_carterae.AAC.1